ncbi:MAG: MFS transporter [Coriobacteriales bacterium]
MLREYGSHRTHRELRLILSDARMRDPERTYAELAIGSMFGSFGGILFSLFMAGRLGRGNTRVWMSACMAIAAICEFLLSFMTAIWQYWVLQFLLTFAFTGCMFLPINTLLARWFVDKKGLATGIVYAGAGIGGMILSPAPEDLHRDGRVAHVLCIHRRNNRSLRRTRVLARAHCLNT